MINKLDTSIELNGRTHAALFSRREALWLLAGAAGLLQPPTAMAVQQHESRRYLGKFAAAHGNNARAAALAWFQNARFGLFMHYGLYSQLGKGAWAMLKEKIPLSQYEKLKDSFHPEGFDADRIVRIATDAGMKYVNLTSKHHEGFCLFRTRQTDYCSTESPDRRDLVGELAEACRKHGMAMFLYYSLLDWHHPYFPDPSAGWQFYRPAYAEKPAQYLWRNDGDTRIYVEYMRRQLRELLTQYGPIAGIYFDPVMAYWARPDLFPMEDIYRMIRELQPGCLIAFKQGATGTEDWITPERRPAQIASYAGIAPERRQHAREVEEHAWALNKTKPMELANTLQPVHWGWFANDDGRHRRPEEVLVMLKMARQANANLLLNTGLLPEGCIAAEDVCTLRATGKLRSV